MLGIPGLEKAVSFYFTLAEGECCLTLPYCSHALKGLELTFASKLAQQWFE